MHAPLASRCRGRSVPARDEPGVGSIPRTTGRLAGEVADDEVLSDWRPEHQRLHGWKIARRRLDADLPVPFERRQRQTSCGSILFTISDI